MFGNEKAELLSLTKKGLNRIYIYIICGRSKTTSYLVRFFGENLGLEEARGFSSLVQQERHQGEKGEK